MTDPLLVADPCWGESASVPDPVWNDATVAVLPHDIEQAIKEAFSKLAGKQSTMRPFLAPSGKTLLKLVGPEVWAQDRSAHFIPQFAQFCAVHSGPWRGARQSPAFHWSWMKWILFFRRGEFDVDTPLADLAFISKSAVNSYALVKDSDVTLVMWNTRVQTLWDSWTGARSARQGMYRKRNRESSVSPVREDPLLNIPVLPSLPPPVPRIPVVDPL